MRNVENYRLHSPCQPTNADHDDTRVSPGTQVPSQVQLTFTPFNRFGFCESAQEGGYINTGKFNSQIDITKPLFLTAERDNHNEEIYYHYFKVEIYNRGM